MPTWIYGLVCPETGSVRYVGKGADPQARFVSHRSESAAQGVRRWFSDLEAKGLQPALVLLERVADTESAFAAEREWIARFGRFGRLLNERPSVADIGSPVWHTPTKDSFREAPAVVALSAREGAIELLRVALGVTTATVLGWLAGTNRPSPSHRSAIRVLLGIPEADWLTARERDVVDAAARRAATPTNPNPNAA